jgi:hypothetical protein
MPTLDAMPPLLVAKQVPTNRIGDVAVIPLGLAALAFLSLRAHFYNSVGNNSTAPVNIAVYGGPNQTGQVYVAQTSLSTILTANDVALRNMSASGAGTLQAPVNAYIYVSLASGSPGSMIDIAVFGYALP